MPRLKVNLLFIVRLNLKKKLNHYLANNRQSNMFFQVGLLYFVSSLGFISSQSVNPDVLLNLVSIVYDIIS